MISTSNLAPIVIFTYNRFDHTNRTITALKENTLAKDSHLIVYSDGAKNEKDQHAVLQIRDYLKKLEGFKSIAIVEQLKNRGLANNIVEGVSAIIEQYGKVIVLEDDILVAPNFLEFMNDALEYYEHKASVWHISGYSFPVKKSKFKNTNIVFSRLMDCWGWATWKDRWQHFEKKPQQLVDIFSANDIQKFDFRLRGVSPFWAQVIDNHKGTLNTWAIFWYATIFIHKGLCIFPVNSFVKNIGLDGTGEHCSITNRYDSDIMINTTWQFTDNIKEDARYAKEIRNFYSLSNKQKIENIKQKIRSFLYRVNRFNKKTSQEKIKTILRIFHIRRSI